MFIDRLIEKVKEKNNPTCLGLDPSMEYIPRHLKDKAFSQYGVNLKGAAYAIYDFNKMIIDAVYDVVGVVKPQLAYYEMYGLDGIEAFQKTVLYAKEKGMLVIADGKRNDIGSTAKSYSNAYLGNTIINEEKSEKAFDVDALTVNPYLGTDGVKPFIEDSKQFGKGIFILVKTSNKSSGELQDLIVDGGKTIYQVVADLVDKWGFDCIGKYGYSSIGAVVGATYPKQAEILREIMKKAYILVPGYGAQGGTAKNVAGSFNKDGLGAIVNASRSIMCAYKSDRWKGEYKEEEFDKAARAEVLRMRDDINGVINL